MQTDTKQQCTVHFPHVYTQNHNAVLIFLGHPVMKHKHVPQLHLTEKTDRNFDFENASSLPECLSQCVNKKLCCLGRSKILCQMHAAQLFTAPCSTNAKQVYWRLGVSALLDTWALNFIQSAWIQALILVAVTSRRLAWYLGELYDKSRHRFVEIVQRIRVSYSMGEVGIQWMVRS